MEYKELFNRAKAAHGTGAYDDATLEFLFPELAESEDERMINGLQGFLSAFGSDYFGTGGWQKFDDWLEKQKEQKPRDYRKLYKGVSQSDWFKENYVGKSLGEEQKPEWSEADEVYLEDALWCVEKAEKSCKDGDDKGATSEHSRDAAMLVIGK